MDSGTRSLFRIVFRHSDKCVRPVNASSGNVATEQWEIEESDKSQLWRFEHVTGDYYVGINKLSGKVLDVFDRTPHDTVGVWSRHNGLNQLFRFSATGAQSGYFFIHDKKENKVFDVVSESPNNGARVISYPKKSSGTANQEVRFVREEVPALEPIPGRVYSVRNVNSGKCLGVENASIASGANVEQQNCNGDPHQKLMVYLENGFYGLRFEHSLKMIDIGLFSLDNGANALQWPLKSSGQNDNQLFELIDFGDGTYSFAFKHSGKCLDIHGDSQNDGANVIQKTCDGYPYNKSQRFTFEDEGPHLPLSDQDGDSVPDVVELVTGHDPNDANDSPEWVTSNKVVRSTPDEDEVVQYDYSDIPGYESRSDVRIGVEGNLLADNLAPIVWVAEPADYEFSLPTLPENYGILGEVFNVSTVLNAPGSAAVDTLTMGIALPDNRPDWVSSQFMKVFRYNGSSWEEVPISTVTHRAVYFTAREFSPLVVAIQQVAPVVFVDSSVSVPTGQQDGTSWATAYATLVQALEDEATDIREVWVAKGTYWPTGVQTGTDRTASFQLKDNIEYYGGFPPHGSELNFSSSYLHTRDYEVFQTILSGNIGDPEDDSDNSYTVVKGASSGSFNRLDGFIIEEGRGSSSPTATDEEKHGAGMDNVNASLFIQNCIFRNNETTFDNGSGGGDGGAVWNPGPATPRITNVRFYNNIATGRGGAIATWDASITIEFCRFLDNSASREGGALFTDGGSGFSVNASVFVRNVSGFDFGGMVSSFNSDNVQVFATFTNCTIFGQQPPKGTNSIITADGLAVNRIRNSILWANGQANEDITGTAEVSYSIVEDGFPGEGNKDEDALFANTEGCLSVDCPLYLLPGSPAIDAANGDFSVGGDVNLNPLFDYPTTPNTGAGSPNYLDIGAFENQEDTDGDGIPDQMEIEGVSGAISNVPGDPLYANPFRKDVFVEVDWMQDGLHVLIPSAASIEDVEAAFANAPVGNPDGTQGINLHVDVSNAVPWEDLTSITSTDWSNFDALKTSNFPSVRSPYYHYCIFVNRFNDAGHSGISRGIPGSDFVVALGQGLQGELRNFRSDETVSGTFMHELGHNLGLRHGGSDDVNYKPNFLSVMNYFFQFFHISNVGDNRLDYSRFYLDDLNEISLSEPAGLDVTGKGLVESAKSDADLEGYGTRRCTAIGCPRGLDPENSGLNGVSVFPPIDKNVDWNDNEGGMGTETNVSLNLNGDAIGGAELLTVLRGNYHDWDRVIYNGDMIGEESSPFVGRSPMSYALLPDATICPVAPPVE